MVGEVLNIGDEVVVNIEDESRSWGYNPYPNGTVGKVTGFSPITYGRIKNFGLKPGVYNNRCWIDVDFGGKHTNINSFYIELKDAAEYARRLKAYREAGGWATWDNSQDFIKPLPETKFWEFDKVRCSRHSFADIKEMYVVRINWNYIDKPIDGSSMPLYDVSEGVDAGWWSSVDESELELISRGNVWKYFHDEPIEFADLRDEVHLHTSLGLEDEIRNPNNGLYSWTLREAVAAIRDGIADGFSQSHLLGASAVLNVKRFRDRELGERVRIAILAEFTETAVEELTSKYGD